MRFLIHWLVNAAGFLTAIAIVPGITPTTPERTKIVAIAAIAGIINTVLTPLFKFFTFPLAFLTLGLWLWVANMIMFWFAGYLGREMGFGFTVNGFWPTFWGALVVSIVSAVFGSVLLPK